MRRIRRMAQALPGTLAVAAILVGLGVGGAVVPARGQEESPNVSPLTGVLQLVAGVGGGLLGGVVGGTATLPGFLAYVAVEKECQRWERDFSLFGPRRPDARVHTHKGICSFSALPYGAFFTLTPFYAGITVGTFAGIVGVGQALGVPGSQLGTAFGVTLGQGAIFTLLGLTIDSYLRESLADLAEDSQELPSPDRLKGLRSLYSLGFLLLPALLGVLGYYWGP